MKAATARMLDGGREPASVIRIAGLILLACCTSRAGAEPLGPCSRRTGLVISELLLHPAGKGGARFIELYNAQPFSENLSGWRISGSWNFTFTNQTLAPGAFLVVTPEPARIRDLYGITEVAGGFPAPMQMEGGRVLLHHRSGAILLEVNHASRGSPRARAGHSLVLANPSYGEGDPRAWASSAKPGGSPGRPEPAEAIKGDERDRPEPTGQVVINEIMFHPPAGDDDQFVELLNRGAAAVNLAGWRLRGGIRYEFPAQAVIAPGGFVVVARNPSRLRKHHPGLTEAAIYGGFRGRLAHRGEPLTLERPGSGAGILVDEVSWHCGGQWGRWTSGGGSSLELRDARADRRCADHWGASDETAKSDWTSVEFTGQLIQGDGPGSNRLEMILCGEGECLLDDVEVLYEGRNLLEDADAHFDRRQGRWVAQGNHEESAWQSAGGSSNSPCFHMRATGRGDYYFNRVRIGLSHSIPANATATLRARARWLRGSPDLVLRLSGNFLEAVGRMPVPANLGTPGQPNSRATGNLGPAIYDVKHTPLLPAAGQPITVSVRLSDPDGIAHAEVQYRVDGADGTSSADLALTDGVYRATLPPAAVGQLVAFRIRATDGRGATHEFPAPEPAYPGDPHGRECLVRFGEPQPPTGNRRFPGYHLWLTRAAFEHWSRRGSAHNGPIPATFVYQDQRAVYLASVRYSGSFNTRAVTSSPLDPLNRSPLGGYNLAFPGEDAMLGADEMALDSNARPGFAQHEQVALWVARELDLPASHRRYVHVFLNGVQRTVFEDVQQPDRDMLKEYYPDDPGPELYKVEVWWRSTDFPQRGSYHDESPLSPFLRGDARNLARYRWTFQKRVDRGDANDYRSLFALVDAVNAPAGDYTAAVERAVDVEEWMRAMALQRIVGNHDSWGRHAPHNLYACKPRDGGWQLIPYDMDYSFFGGEEPDSDLVRGAFGGDPVLMRMLEHPPFLRAYLRALQDAVNGPLFRDPKTGRLPRVDAFLETHYDVISRINDVGAAELAPDYLGPDWRWSLRGWFEKRHAAIRTTLRRYGQPPFAAELLPRPAGALRGTAPIEVKSILANGTPLTLTWPTVTTWEASLPSIAPGKPLLLQGVDRLRRPLPAARADVSRRP